MTEVVIVKSRLSFSGGLEKMTLAIAEAFVSKGCQVTILTTGNDYPNLPGVRVVSLGIPPRWTYLAIHFFYRACDKWLRTHPSDLVFGLDRTSKLTHYRAGNGAHKIFLKRKKCSWIKSYFAYINPKDYLIQKIEKKIFESPKLKVLFTNSSMVREEILKEYKIAPQKIQVVFNGIDLQKYCWNPDSKEKALKSLGLDPSKKQLLFIGNGYRRKGLHFLLKSLSLLGDAHYHLSIVGKEKYQLKYKAFAKKLGLSSKVSFFGPKSDLIPFYHASDCFVFPTTYDPFAGVTLEALAMGLYVITSPYNGAKEVIKEGAGEILKNLDNPQDLADKIQGVIEGRTPLLSREEIRNSIEGYQAKEQLNKIVDYSLTHA